MKVIFLDVDGVLNTDKYSKKQAEKNNGKIECEMAFNFDPEAMTNLKEIINVTNAYIVISSTWRLGYDDKEDPYWPSLIKNLKDYDLDKKIIGVTPVICDAERPWEVTRGDEIMRWLYENREKKIGKFAIIDDEDCVNGSIKKNFVRCNPYYGITKSIKSRVIELLS